MGFFPTERQEGPANANTAVLDLMWIDGLPIVVTLLNPGQRRTSKRVNLYTQRCLGRHLANSSRGKRCRKRRTPGRKLQLGHFLAELVDSVWSNVCETDYASDLVKRGFQNFFPLFLNVCTAM